MSIALRMGIMAQQMHSEQVPFVDEPHFRTVAARERVALDERELEKWLH